MNTVSVVWRTKLLLYRINLQFIAWSSLTFNAASTLFNNQHDNDGCAMISKHISYHYDYYLLLLFVYIFFYREVVFRSPRFLRLCSAIQKRYIAGALIIKQHRSILSKKKNFPHSHRAHSYIKLKHFVLACIAQCIEPKITLFYVHSFGRLTMA